MPETTTPHREGSASAVEATPGAALAILLVYCTSGTKHALNDQTAGALVMVASVASSYVLAFIREYVGRIARAFGKGVSE